ncbi:MAG: Rieske 2Fe-2S domain-containing protein [Gemmatimonas sp.]
MLSREDNEAMTKVGKGTPAGELLRRYWHPVCVAGELTEQKPIKPFRLLGEDLLVYRRPPAPGATEPSYGIAPPQCPHRRAGLAYGLVDCEGIRCTYHGWKFAPDGRCLEMPAEPPNTPFKDKIRITAYPVQKLAGLLWTYMGPQPAPLLPRWDVLVREDGRRWTVIESVIDCNWLQAMENSVDPAHLFWLHGSYEVKAHLSGMEHYNEKHDFIKFEYGISKRRTTPGKTPSDPPMIDEHPLLFPTTLRHVAKMRDKKTSETLFRHNLQIRVPIDDTHTRVYRVNFTPTKTDRSPENVDPPFEYRPLKDENGVYDLTIVGAQDSMAWETQGPIHDRTQENLGVSDVGIAALRRLLKEQLEIVRNGGDPMGVIRDPAKNKVIMLDVVNERIGLKRAEPSAELVG